NQALHALVATRRFYINLPDGIGCMTHSCGHGMKSCQDLTARHNRFLNSIYLPPDALIQGGYTHRAPGGLIADNVINQRRRDAFLPVGCAAFLPAFFAAVRRSRACCPRLLMPAGLGLA